MYEMLFAKQSISQIITNEDVRKTGFRLSSAPELLGSTMSGQDTALYVASQGSQSQASMKHCMQVMKCFPLVWQYINFVCFREPALQARFLS